MSTLEQTADRTASSDGVTSPRLGKLRKGLKLRIPVMFGSFLML
jgi:hypothetical protein